MILKKRKVMALPEIQTKTNRVLKIILIAFLVIVFRIWHLGVIQQEERVKEAQKPQQRTLLLRANRGTICDRFHIPMALNRISYNAAIYYSQISQIPIISWETGPDGKRVKVSTRKEYIRKLAHLLAQTLGLDEGRIEDLIHAKASLFPHVPFILKAGLSEEEHYRLKMLEGDWPGIHAEIAAERFYPLGKTGAEIIGTMGAINQREYGAIAHEIHFLQQIIDLYEKGLETPLPPEFKSFEELYQRCHELKEKAYTLNDLVGKTGIEAQLEEELRGYFGKKTFEVDQKGRFLREFSGSRGAVSGRQIVLSISSELQQFAESLLAQDEKIREGRSLGLDGTDKTRKVQKQPWIKGGAIVALEPTTGEVLALASYPRFDPNDFIPSANPEIKHTRQSQLRRWLESETFLGALWDGKDVLTRERFGGTPRRFYEEKQELNWEFFLDSILPTDSSLRLFFRRFDDVKSAIQLQEDFEALLYFSKESDPALLIGALFPEPAQLKSPIRAQILEALRSAGPEAGPHQKRLEHYLGSIPSNSDKLFLIDLCRTAVYSPAFSDPLIAQIGSLKIGSYRSLCQSFQRLETDVRSAYQEAFRQNEFKAWREAHQKAFLKEKRKEEKEKKTYAHPFTDYLDKQESELFAEFWKEKRIPLLTSAIQQSKESELRDFCKGLSPHSVEEFLRTFRSFADLNRPLLMSYRGLRHRGLEQTEKDLAASVYPIGGFGFSRSYAFQSGSPQGSIFKLITAYEGLRQGKSLTLVDEWKPMNKGQMVAFGLNGTPYPRYYKGGRLPRSHSSQIGKIDLLGALEQSSNSYFAILAGDYFEDPQDLARAASLFGFGEKTGIELPGEIAGKIPNDLKTNRTGLYSLAIGQHTLLNTPLQTATMLAAIANGGALLKPKIVREAIGFSPERKPLEAFAASSYFAKEELEALGISFPLFTGMQTQTPLESTEAAATQIRRSIWLPAALRMTLLEGMDRAVWGTKGSARTSVIKYLLANPVLMRDYLSLQHQMLGKTSTAEIPYNPNKNPSSRAQIYKHTWFGAMSFPTDRPLKGQGEKPELVVVVFLRYGDGGKEAAPLAAQMIRKWREIQAKHL
jgi:cell division protein FtsI/penicillin-binding protein 2